MPGFVDSNRIGNPITTCFCLHRLLLQYYSRLGHVPRSFNQCQRNETIQKPTTVQKLLAGNEKNNAIQYKICIILYLFNAAVPPDSEVLGEQLRETEVSFKIVL